MKILVVDDNPVNVTLLCSLIGQTGSRYESAENGAKAVELVSKNRYNLVLMDQFMPGMSGTDAMKRIRELDSSYNRYTRIVCLTANREEGLKEKFILEGFDDYLPKPVNPVELKNLIFRYGQEPPGRPEEKVGSAGLSWRSDLKFVNIEHGIINCGGDGNQFEEVMKIILRYGRDKIAKLDDYLREGDMDLYAVEVHAMKSNAGTIGAKDLAAKAQALEDAARNGDRDTVFSGHSAFVEEYDELLNELKLLTDSPSLDRKPTKPSRQADKGYLDAEPGEYMQTFREILDCVMYGSYEGAEDLIDILKMFSLPSPLSECAQKISDHLQAKNYQGIIDEITQLLKTVDLEDGAFDGKDKA
ncbi:MAG: response regulator [Lachnospiraceae bacterium]|nr:response regulator [Lachnospiraceae bacterium]